MRSISSCIEVLEIFEIDVWFLVTSKTVNQSKQEINGFEHARKGT